MICYSLFNKIYVFCRKVNIVAQKYQITTVTVHDWCDFYWCDGLVVLIAEAM